MHWLSRVVAAIVLSFVAFTVQAVEIPGRVFACSCAEDSRSLIEIALRDPVTIVVGTVGVAQWERTPLAVDTWFHGPFPADVIWLTGGTNMKTSCDVSIAAGERRLLVLWGGPRAPAADGLYSTSLCEPTGVIGTPAGDALLAEAMQAFAALPPPSALPESGAPLDLSAWLAPTGLAWLTVAAVASGALLLLLVLVARRRPTDR